jgi:predicted HicB family RNase H-like nuclease
MFKYKNYIGQLLLNEEEETEILSGEVINIRDVITFQGTSVAELKQAFIDSVEDYLTFCKERNEEPDRPFSGRFNLRLKPTLHREAYIAARQAHMSLNAWVEQAIEVRAHQR